MFSLNNNNKYLSYDNNIIRYTQYECYIWNLYEFNKTVDTIFYIVNKDKETLYLNNTSKLSTKIFYWKKINHNEYIYENIILKVSKYKLSLGICNWGSLYQFSNKSLLEEGHNIISNEYKMFDTLKIYMGKRIHKIYGISYVKGMTLLDIAKLPEYINVLTSSMYKNIIIVCHSTHREKSNYWNEEFTSIDKINEENEFNDLAMFLRNIKNTTFILQNWESDNYRLVNNDVSIRMISWIKSRQSGIDRYRKNNIIIEDNVFHAIEINRIGVHKMITDIIPHIRIDLVSYSCYDSQENPVLFENNIKYILSQIKRERNYTFKQIPECLKRFRVPLYIGEFGLSHNNNYENHIINTLNNVFHTSSKYELPFINFWNLYNNEPNRMYGLIDDKNTKTVSAKWFCVFNSYTEPFLRISY